MLSAAPFFAKSKTNSLQAHDGWQARTRGLCKQDRSNLSVMAAHYRH
jgi:hypothetical protein